MTNIVCCMYPMHGSVHHVCGTTCTILYSLGSDYIFLTCVSVDRIFHYSTIPLRMWLLAQGLHTLHSMQCTYVCLTCIEWWSTVSTVKHRGCSLCFKRISIAPDLPSSNHSAWVYQRHPLDCIELTVSWAWVWGNFRSLLLRPVNNSLQNRTSSELNLEEGICMNEERRKYYPSS